MTSAFPDIRSLHQDRTAALAPLYGFILLFFAWGMATTLNTGEVAYDKIRTQNAADALALAHAEQAARDLNVMSMNNMALVQMLTVSAVTFTLMETLADIQLRAATAQVKIVRSAASKCGINPYCWALHAAISMQVLTTQIKALQVYLRYRPEKGFSTSQRMIDGLNRMNDHLVQSFPRRSGEIMKLLMKENRIDSVFTYPPCRRGGGSDCRGGVDEGGDLPVERGAVQSVAAHMEICRGAEKGADGDHRQDYTVHGYPRGKGPYTAGGSSGKPHLRDHVEAETGLSWLLPFFGEATLRFWDPLIRFGSTKYRQRQKARDNDFTRRMNRNWTAVCGGMGGVTSSVLGAVFKFPKPYWLKGRPEATVLAPVLGPMAQDTDKLAFLILAAKERGPRFNPEEFGERSHPYHAYAQAMVYNPVSYDLFTSRWKARLVPAKFMDQPGQVADALRNSTGAGQFRIVSEIILRARGSRQWSQVNAH